MRTMGQASVGGMMSRMDPPSKRSGFKPYAQNYQWSDGNKTISWVAPEGGLFRFYLQSPGGNSARGFNGSTFDSGMGSAGGLAVKTKYVAKDQIVAISVGTTGPTTITFPDGLVVSATLPQAAIFTDTDADGIYDTFTPSVPGSGLNGDYNITGYPGSAVKNTNFVIPSPADPYAGLSILTDATIGPGGPGFAPDGFRGGDATFGASPRGPGATAPLNSGSSITTAAVTIVRYA
jgi:hypothetical protein